MALNNRQWLICHKTKRNLTKEIFNLMIIFWGLYPRWTSFLNHTSWPYNRVNYAIINGGALLSLEMDTATRVLILEVFFRVFFFLHCSNIRRKDMNLSSPTSNSEDLFVKIQYVSKNDISFEIYWVFQKKIDINL